MVTHASKGDAQFVYGADCQEGKGLYADILTTTG